MSRRHLWRAGLATLCVATFPSTARSAVAAADGPPAVLQTPVLSLRRLPDLLSRTVGAIKLAGALDTTLADPRLGGGVGQSCLIVNDGGRTIYSRRPTQMLIPASNLKLLTAMAAVDKLGASDRLSTAVTADHAPSNGTITGNLYLVGGGDPLLRTPDYVANLHYREQIYDDLNVLADRVRAAGITRVTGSVIGDDSRYDTQRYVPTWPARYAGTGEVGPLSALSVNDGFSAWRPAAVPAAQPAEQAAATLAGLLQQRGVAIAGAPAPGTAPAGGSVVARFDSPPLPDVLAEVLRRSDNNGAELITKELGRQANPQTPTTLAGVAVTVADLRAAGLPVDQLHMVDGSGLDRSDRASCQLVLSALLRSGADGTLGRGLPVAGQSGTLEKRMLGTVAAGRVRAKTGSLEGVTALSGFVTPTAVAAGAPAGSAPGVAFSLLVNGLPNMATGDALSDRVAILLAQFPQAPPVSLLGPLPAG